MGETREIHLQEEAYLTDIHNKKRPFIVHLADNQIEVFGIEFFCYYYLQDDLIQDD